MKVEFWFIGKTNETYLETGIGIYEKRLRRYLPFQMQCLPDVRQAGNLAPEQLKTKEGEAILCKIKSEDLLVLLDEKGQSFTSEGFARYVEQQLSGSKHRLIFLVGGAYGFSWEVYQRADAKLALSAMTFSHQMVRLFFLEQLYRAMTILRGEPYHNT
ncbi:MAG: 23S rRNA (pseudouridine(1915)-N(3))-methyltransferase RlmH [Saprospiraceae bacterium]